MAKHPLPIIASELAKTVLVANYFYRVRMEAARALVMVRTRSGLADGSIAQASVTISDYFYSSSYIGHYSLTTADPDQTTSRTSPPTSSRRASFPLWPTCEIPSARTLGVTFAFYSLRLCEAMTTRKIRTLMLFTSPSLSLLWARL